jgi:hypothetical protein
MGFLDDFTRNNSAVWKDASYWRALCPSLNLSGKNDTVHTSEPTGMPTPSADGSSARDLVEERRSRLIQDGYALVDQVGADQEVKTGCYHSSLETVPSYVCSWSTTKPGNWPESHSGCWRLRLIPPMCSILTFWLGSLINGTVVQDSVLIAIVSRMRLRLAFTFRIDKQSMAHYG